MNDGGERRYGPLGTALVIIPTYNEAENIESIVSRVRAAVPKAHILVADDNSPDGTGKIADELAAVDDQVKVLHRKGKEGLGAAYLAGFRWGIEHGYEVLVEMDADGSHQPEELPRLLTALAGADLVLGSRWVPGGTCRQLAQVARADLPRRQLVVPGGCWAYRFKRRHRRLPGVPQGDPAGPRPGRRRLAGLLLPGRSGLARGQGGLQVVEVPITFVERELGDSKMSQRHPGRGAVAGDHLGCRVPGEPSPRPEAQQAVLIPGLSPRAGPARSPHAGRPGSPVDGPGLRCS